MVRVIVFVWGDAVSHCRKKSKRETTWPQMLRWTIAIITCHVRGTIITIEDPLMQPITLTFLWLLRFLEIHNRLSVGLRNAAKSNLIGVCSVKSKKLRRSLVTNKKLWIEDGRLRQLWIKAVGLWRPQLWSIIMSIHLKYLARSKQLSMWSRAWMVGQ